MNGWQKIIGHNWAVELLRGNVLAGRVGHAYLITGPDQVGKTTLARTFAQALNCEVAEQEGRPCGLCRTCRLIDVDRHPDVTLLAGAVSTRGKLSIKIDQIRELQKALSLTAAEARYKVAILRQFDTANVNAANAFLKTLEEPPRNVALLLTAGDADDLLPTVASRCRTLNLRALSTMEIERALQRRWQVAADQARLLAHLANGRVGWAINTARDPAELQVREEQLEMLFEALNRSTVGRFNLAERLSDRPDRLPELLRSWLSLWRDLLLTRRSGPAPGGIVNIDRIDHLHGIATSWPAGSVTRGLRQTQEALWQLEHNANTRLVLENLLLSYPQQDSARELPQP